MSGIKDMSDISKTIERMDGLRKKAPPKAYECENCRDVGFIFTHRSGVDWAEECECTIKKNMLESLKTCGLSESKFKRQTFDLFVATNAFQREMKQKAKAFCSQKDKKFFFAGGQVGSGKTHICTAICNHFFNKAYPFKYVTYPDMTRQLKSMANDDIDYNRHMGILQNVKVLYIDDLFKGKNTSVDSATEADIKHAFTLINNRYENEKITIISSELNLSELINVDEAISSRIKQMCGGYVVNIKKDKSRNYRYKEEIE